MSDKLSGYELAVASKAMRGTVWLWDDTRNVYVNPTFQDWEAMAAALAEPGQAKPAFDARAFRQWWDGEGNSIARENGKYYTALSAWKTAAGVASGAQQLKLGQVLGHIHARFNEREPHTGAWDEQRIVVAETIQKLLKDYSPVLAAPAVALSEVDVIHLIVEMTDGVLWKDPFADGHVSRFTARLNALLRSGAGKREGQHGQ